MNRGNFGYNSKPTKGKDEHGRSGRVLDPADGAKHGHIPIEVDGRPLWAAFIIERNGEDECLFADVDRVQHTAWEKARAKQAQYRARRRS